MVFWGTSIRRANSPAGTPSGSRATSSRNVCSRVLMTRRCLYRSEDLMIGSTRDDQIARYADMLGALGAEPRLRIVRLLLSAHPEGLVVGEIGSELGIPPSTLSHHLDKLSRKRVAETSLFAAQDLQFAIRLGVVQNKMEATPLERGRKVASVV